MTSAFEPPDILVLGGGGILGEAWMTGVLAGIERASGWDARTARGYVGTSAGSIVAAALAAGESPLARAAHEPDLPPAEGAPAKRSLLGGTLNVGRAAGAAIASPFAALGIRGAAPGGALVRRAVLDRVPAGTRSLAGLGRRFDTPHGSWDPRLRVAAVALSTGRRVVFGAPGAPPASVGQAVEASCAIPGYFTPVQIGGERYVDGGAWSPTNSDAAEAERGDRVLCLNPTGGTGGPAAAIGWVSRGAAAVESLAVRRRGAAVDTVAPDAAALAVIGGRLMDPGPRAEATAAGQAQGLRLGRAR